ncbi:hypothetical protein B0H66DRAFT_82990 [Apodospora peruviana]|uniref:Neurofilament medium polypeptide protein n=1 Tax=Apodospora peruviana TaxID=516989 RepID=A0AAE0ITQ1_9PEZI|nr:hypothetical protein B0H66DRAFT_82990 [Apodospora peruviana]
MKSAALFLCLLTGGALATAVDFQDSMHREFRMGMVVPRQAAAAPKTNLQVFSGALGGVAASAITDSGDPQRPFGVDGDTFPDFATAAIRACDNQKNSCAKQANSQQGTFKVSDCDKQSEECKATAKGAEASAPTFVASAPATATFFSSNEEFDFFCE